MTNESQTKSQVCKDFINKEIVLCSLCRCQFHSTCCVGKELDGAWTCATCLEDGGQYSTRYKEWQATEPEEIGADNTQGVDASVENSNLKISGNSPPRFGKLVGNKTFSKRKLLKIQQLAELYLKRIFTQKV